MLTNTEILIGFFTLAPLLAFVALFDILRRPSSDFTDAGQNQIVWLLVSLLAPSIGPILYFIIGRPKLPTIVGKSQSKIQRFVSIGFPTAVALFVVYGFAR